jgi:hypothetical protein
MRRTAENNVNYQLRAREFAVGDRVTPYGYFDAQAGRVVAVWPAIGMIDVEFPTGSKRLPVEEAQRIDDSGVSDPPRTNSVPGASPTVTVPGTANVPARRVAHAFVKKALYWSGPDRQYRLTRAESGVGSYYCPKCGEGNTLQRAIYKRREGKSERLFGCGSCLFLIKELDIINLAGE